MAHPLIALSLFVSLFCAFFAQPLFAGNSEGNGGNVVVCPSPKPGQKAVELLDFYEARTRGIAIDLGAADLPWVNKLEIIAQRLRPIDPLRARLFERQFNGVGKSIRFLSGVELNDTNDSSAIALPSGCSLGQTAVQKKTLFPEEPWITINQEFWDQLDNDGKAGLILHELLLSEALQNGTKSSFNVRYLVGAFSSRLSEKWDGLQYSFYVGAAGLFDLVTISGGLTEEKEKLRIEFQSTNLQTQHVWIFLDLPTPTDSTATLVYNDIVTKPLELNSTASVSFLAPRPGERDANLFLYLNPPSGAPDLARILVLDNWGTVIRTQFKSSNDSSWSVPLDFSSRL